MRRQNLVLTGALFLSLFLAYRIWTEEASPVLNTGDFTIWRGDATQVDSVTYTSQVGHVRIERRTDPVWGGYLWGVALGGEQGEDSDTVNFDPSPGFRVGQDGETVIAAFAHLTALREFGVLTDVQAEGYGLAADSVARLRVYFHNEVREIAIGPASYGSSDRYAMDTRGVGYVLTNEYVNLIEGGARFLKERRLHAYSPEDVRTARLQSSDGELLLVRTAGQYGNASWSPQSEPESVNPALTNFMETFNSLWFSDITNIAQRDLITAVARADFFGGDGRQLGYLELFRWDGIEGSPLYYIETEVTREPVEVLYIDTPQALERELPTLF